MAVLLFTLISAAQSIPTTISGTVLDETGEPLVGATLRLKKSGFATITDFDGQFLLVSTIDDDLPDGDWD